MNCETVLGKEVCYKWDWVASSVKEMGIVKRFINACDKSVNEIEKGISF